MPLRWLDRWVLAHAPTMPPLPPDDPDVGDTGLTALEKEVLYARLQDVENTLKMYEAKAKLRRRQRAPDNA